ncbi:hypothetical protein LTR85_005476 [Meristemomyces frigidus]|nr:hypothetical protein LTR85_005476 [Meristemomyces frigidus]
MPIFAQQHLPIPTKDLLSWCHDNRSAFDQDKAIYIDCANPKRSISANQAYTLIRKLTAGFRAAGLQKGDCVCLHAFNNLYYPLLVQGIVGAGGCFVGTNPSYTSYELHHAFKLSHAKFIIAEPDLLAAIKPPAASLGIPNKRILLFAAQAGQRVVEHATWRSLLDHGEQDWLRFNDLHTAQTTTAFLMFSSGTTGLPKAAQLSHYNLIAQHTLVHENPSHPESYNFSRIACLPMFHAAVAPFAHTSVLRSGYQALIMRRFNLHGFLAHTERFAATNLMMVPPMVVAVVDHAKTHPDAVRHSLRSVVAVIAGAAPLDKDTQQALQDLLQPGAAFTQLWAMTETSCVASYLYHPENDDTGSVGRFMPNIDVKVVDEDDKEVGPYDVRGELCVRGPTVIRGYLDNAEANARDWDQEGFFHTGDIVYCDSQTRLWYVVDRKKELIKVRGFQVAPSELEGVLLAHPGIVDVAVIGIPAATADFGSEAPRAYVVRRAGMSVEEGDVHAWVEERLARYKRLEGGVKFVEGIPKTASGKILKRVLREEVKREMGAKL